MNQQQQDLSQSPSLRDQYAAGFSWFALLCQVLETSVIVFLRRGFGCRYLGGQAAAVIPVVFVYYLFCKGQDIRPLFCFLGLFLLACLKARIGTLLAERRGDVVHSYYSGTPSVMQWPVFRGRLSESTAKRLVDPLSVLLLGIACLPYSEPLGSYLMVAAGACWISVMLATGYQKERVLNARDAYISQRDDAEQFRRGNWR